MAQQLIRGSVAAIILLNDHGLKSNSGSAVVEKKFLTCVLQVENRLTHQSSTCTR